MKYKVKSVSRRNINEFKIIIQEVPTLLEKIFSFGKKKSVSSVYIGENFTWKKMPTNEIANEEMAEILAEVAEIKINQDKNN